jgi:co-chaperonin GroES (HSP10)
MSTNIVPMADYVLAQQEEAESKTASGIFLPSN